MKKSPNRYISRRINLVSATIVHCCVEIPFFIFPVIILLVGSDLFPNLGRLSWLGLGTIGTVGTLAAGLPSPIFGRLADKYHRSLLMLISLILSTVGSVLVGLFSKSFGFMILGVILMGLGLALYHPAGLSWISSEYENPEDKSYSPNYVKILAIHGIGGSFGISIGPLSVYFFLHNQILHWYQIYLFWAIPLSLIALLFWFMIGKHANQNHVTQPFLESENIDRASHRKSISLILTFIFGYIAAMSLTRGMISFILSPFLSEIKNFEIATAALFIGISTLIGATGQVLGGTLGDIYGEKMILSACALIQMTTLFFIYVIEVNMVLLVLYITLALVNALFWPSTNSLVAKNTPHRGTAFGMVMLTANIVGALGPFFDGFLLVVDPLRYFLIFLISGIFSFIGFISLLLLNFFTHKK